MLDSYLTFQSAPEVIGNQLALKAKGLFLYSTAQVVDSGGNIAFQVDLIPASGDDLGVSAQLLVCSYARVNQQAVADAQSHQLIEVTPSIKKTASTWPSPIVFPSVSDAPYLEKVSTMPEMSLMDLAYEFYRFVPDVPYSNFNDFNLAPLSMADLFLIQQLNLVPVGSFNRTNDIRVALHELENALSAIFASMMWTLGNMPFPKWYAELKEDDLNLQSSVVRSLQGNATVTLEITQTRLDLSIIAVIGGLAVSIALTLLSLPYTTSGYRDTNNAQDIPIDGTGILYAIWLYRNHPELEGLVHQVEHPTHHNLREAGMVRTSLIGGLHARKTRKLSEFELVA
ncbi:hypothetical protein MVEN_01444600 [Mycena venus]|uniref:Uncharacterized protein n=1 Tax=Mycena venus TaxID=2733690 RepID=A0A8H6XTJ3_9AGAR|nr:hypothetical protein MVEN_01444600 [Mycena venus]